MIKIRKLFFCLLLYSGTGYTQYPQQVLRNQIEQLLKVQGLSGAVWSIVNDSGIITTDAVGYRHQPTQSRLLPHHKMHVGSVSKTVLSVGLLRMVTLGLLQLDDPLRNYLPDLPIINPWEATHPVTIRHLLDHRSGLTDAKLWQVFSTTADKYTPLKTAYERSPGILTVQLEPGTIYSYSNLGYTLLGLVIEKITKQRYEAYLDKWVLHPLGMTQSTFEFISQQEDTSLAYGHFDHGIPVTAMPMYLRPAGQFTTTAEDMGKFLRFLMSDGTLNGDVFIRNDLLKSIGIQTATIAYQKGVPYGDALGGYTRDRYGVVGIAKNGNILGFSAMIYFFPSERKAFFIAHNTDSETADYDLFNEVLVRHLRLSHQPFLSKHVAMDAQLFKWEGYYVPVITKVFPFQLFDILFAHVKVDVNNEGAILSPLSGPKKRLLYQGQQLFSMEDRTAISHVFYSSMDGGLFISDGIRTIKKLSIFKIGSLAISFVFGLLGLTCLVGIGGLSFFKGQYRVPKNPYLWIFVPVLLICFSIVLMVNQPFMQFGDLNFASTLMTIGSIALLLGNIFFIFIEIQIRRRFFYSLPFWASFLVLQWMLLLTFYGLIPLVLWR